MKLARVAFSIIRALGAVACTVFDTQRARSLELSRRRLTLNPRLLFR